MLTNWFFFRERIIFSQSKAVSTLHEVKLSEHAATSQPLNIVSKFCYFSKKWMVVASVGRC